jgi:hypothetical protein
MLPAVACESAGNVTGKQEIYDFFISSDIV